MKSTITGFWRSVTFYCKHHPESPMVLQEGVKGAYYACPYEMREPEPCHNYITLKQAEQCLQKLMNTMTEAIKKGDMGNLTHYKFTLKGIKYYVMKHDPDDDSMSIMVDNTAILWR